MTVKKDCIKTTEFFQIAWHFNIVTYQPRNSSPFGGPRHYPKASIRNFQLPCPYSYVGPHIKHNTKKQTDFLSIL